jgi:hypothetical protein
VLNVKIGSATQFDTIAIGGAASLAGTLNVSVINSFVPSAGQAFKVLTFASSNGDFTTITGLAIPNNPNLSFNPVLNPSDFTLLASAPSAGVLQFSAPTYTVNVTSGTATVTVVRNNGSQGSVTVNYATSDGTAMAGVSYTASSGTLTFAQGVTSQTITIPILSGAIGKGDQTLNLTISAPTGGATLGTQTSAVLMLIDNTPNSQAGQLQFSTSAYTALVAGGTATITVARASGSMGTVTVQYATSNGTAQAGVRYTATSGTLTFANGVTTQSFTIPLLNPRTVVGNQTVNLTLSNVTGGAAVGSPVTAVLTIVDNNVSDDVSFISGVYHDVLGRVADAGGLASFQLTLDAGRNQVLVQFATVYVISPENRSDFVTNAYLKYLRRTPSQPEVASWLSLIQQGLNEEAVISSFVSSMEYFAKQGGTNSGWLDHVYQDLLGRARDPGSQPFLDELNGGVPLGVVANALLGSTEYRTRVITQAYATYLQRQAGSGDVQAWISVVGNAAATPGGVSGDEQLLIGVLSSVEYFQTSGNTITTWASSLYTKLLGRNPSQAELTNLIVVVLNGFMAPRQATAAAIATSAEAESNAVAGYYTQFLGRTASPSEISPWVNLILSGTSREQVIANIVGSAEYFQKQGGTNTQFVDQLYLDLLGRAADSGASGFINALNGGTANTFQVAAAILNSTEYAQRLVNQFYSTVLARQGSLAETNGWVQALTHGTRDEQVLTMLLASDEYFLRLHTYP